VAAVPSGLSLTPLRIIKNNNNNNKRCLRAIRDGADDDDDNGVGTKLQTVIKEKMGRRSGISQALVHSLKDRTE
jgi:hypothetical protein